MVTTRSRGAAHHLRSPDRGAEGTWPADDWQGPVLAVRMSSLGDVLVSLDALWRLKCRRPDLHVDLLTHRDYAALCALSPHVRAVFTPESGSLSETYEILWDLQGGVKGRRCARRFQWMRWVSSPSCGLWRRAMVFLGRRIPSPPHQLHRFLQPAAGGEASKVRLRRRGEVLLRPEGARHPRASSPLLGSSPVVGIAPQAKHPLKEWPFRRYTQLARQLEAEGVRTLWFLDPKRQGEAQPDHADCVRAPLEDAAGAMDGCDLVIAGDTGMGHLASALGIPVLVLYGSTVPELGYTPTGAHSVLQVDLPCRPCHVHGAKRCWLGHRRCLHEITPDLVLERVKAALGGSGGA